MVRWMAEVLRVLEVISKQIIELEARVVEIEMMMRDGQRFRMGFLEGLATAEFSDEESSSEDVAALGSRGGSWGRDAGRHCA